MLISGKYLCNKPHLTCDCPQLQGSIMVGSLFQVFVGFSGLIGLFMRFIGPLTIAPTISLIGLSLFDSAGRSAGFHWGISTMWVKFFLGFGIILLQSTKNANSLFQVCQCITF